MNINICEHNLQNASDEAASVFSLLNIIQGAINAGVIIEDNDLAFAIGGVASLAHNLNSDLLDFMKKGNK